MPGIRIEREQAVKVVQMLMESVGIRAASRLTGFDQGTILRILESAGQHCAALLNARVRGLQISRVEADEVFSYIGCKPDKVEDDDTERGAFFIFLSVAAKEKLIINYRVAKRTREEAEIFLRDLKSRLAQRIQLTTDAFPGYASAHSDDGGVRRVFGEAIDFAVESKKFSRDPRFADKKAYFAPKVLKITRRPRIGIPEMRLATANHAERTNLTLRTLSRRFVRCTINFSKKRENHEHAVALFCATFNFCRVHKSLNGQTPAIACGLTDHVWSVAELLTATI